MEILFLVHCLVLEALLATLRTRQIYFQNGKRYRVENLTRSLFLRDLLLDGDNPLKVLAILEYGFL